MAAFLWLLESPACFSGITERKSEKKDEASALFMNTHYTDFKFKVCITSTCFFSAAQGNG